MKELDSPDSWPDPGEGEGYYWIKVRDYWESDGDPVELWTVGYWRSEELWETIGASKSLEWKHILEIGPRLIAPPDNSTTHARQED